MDTQAVVVARTLRKAKRICLVGLSLERIESLKGELRQKTPSEPWVEEQIKSYELIDERGRRMVHRYHDKRAFPPGGAQTTMICCPSCNIYNPPQTFEMGHCLDHSEHEGWGQSPSAAAIEHAQYYNVPAPIELMPESNEALMEEIQNQIQGNVEQIKKC